MNKADSFLKHCYSENLGEMQAFLADPENSDFDINAFFGDQTIFALLCYYNFATAVNLLLSIDSLDPNKPDKNGATPFFLACAKGHIKIIETLLKNEKIDFNKPNQDGITPFAAACLNTKFEAITLLLDSPDIDVNKQNNEGCSPLGQICGRGFALHGNASHQKSIALLLNNARINVNAKNNYEESPFLLACSTAHKEIVQLFLQSPRIENINQPDNRGRTPFFKACSFLRDNIEIIKLLLLDDRIDLTSPDADDATPYTFVATAEFKTKQDEALQLVISNPKILKDIIRSHILWGASFKNIFFNLQNPETVVSWVLSKQNQNDSLEKIFHFYTKEQLAPLILLEAKEIAYKELVKSASILFIYVVLLSDDYLTLKPLALMETLTNNLRYMLWLPTEKSREEKFFSIALRLPMDLQMKLCNVAYKLTKMHVSVSDVNRALKDVSDKEEKLATPVKKA